MIAPPLLAVGKELWAAGRRNIGKAGGLSKTVGTERFNRWNRAAGRTRIEASALPTARSPSYADGEPELKDFFLKSRSPCLKGRAAETRGAATGGASRASQAPGALPPFFT
jgi:hypothetical protein